MVEHGFRKAGVEGSNPSIGCILSRVIEIVICTKGMAVT